MSRKNRTPLASRVVKAAEAALAAKSYVSSIDVLIGIGWLDAGSAERWRRGQIDCLERVVRTNLSRISEAMKLLCSWATKRGLSASPTQYVARTPQRQTLRFSWSGDPTLERLYRTHLGSGGAFRKEARSSGGKSEPRPGAGGGPALEHNVDLPPVRRHRCSASDGESRPRLLALRWPRRSRVPGGGRCSAHAASQSEKRATRCRRALQPKPSPLRATGTTGRAAGCGGGATRSGRPATRITRCGRHDDSRNDEGAAPDRPW